MSRLQVSSGTEWEAQVGYSRAVRTNGQIHVSGTTATDETGAIVGTGDFYEQARQALTTIQSALEQVDASLSDVVRTRMFVTDIDEWEAVGAAHSEFFDEIRPATSMYEVSRLIHPDLLVEIEAVAVVTDLD